jgi:hypothetical protein
MRCAIVVIPEDIGYHFEAAPAFAPAQVTFVIGVVGQA